MIVVALAFELLTLQRFQKLQPKMHRTTFFPPKPQGKAFTLYKTLVFVENKNKTIYLIFLGGRVGNVFPPVFWSFGCSKASLCLQRPLEASDGPRHRLRRLSSGRLPWHVGAATRHGASVWGGVSECEGELRVFVWFLGWFFSMFLGVLGFKIWKLMGLLFWWFVYPFGLTYIIRAIWVCFQYGFLSKPYEWMVEDGWGLGGIKT